jgi:hypothetical protein
MWKYNLYFLAFLIIILIFYGCSSSESQVLLNEEFSLSVGQHVVVTGEELGIRFEEVIEDSRCPRDVTCIWTGRVTCIIKLTQVGRSYRMVLTELGLTDEYSKEMYEEYKLTFHVTPYPEAGKKIPVDAYQLHLIVSKLPQLTNMLGSVLTAPLSYEGKSIIVVGYYRGWDLLHETSMSPPVTRSDWVVKDATGAIYVSANSETKLPEVLQPSSLEDTDIILEVKGVVCISKGGQPYIEATNVECIY